MQPIAEARSAKVSERSELPLGTKKFTNATQCRGARSTGREMGTPSPLRALVLVIALLAWPTGTAEPTAPAPFLVSVDTPAPARAILAVGADGWDVAPDGWNASLVKIRYAVRAWPTSDATTRATAASTHREPIAGHPTARAPAAAAVPRGLPSSRFGRRHTRVLHGASRPKRRAERRVQPFDRRIRRH